MWIVVILYFNYYFWCFICFTRIVDGHHLSVLKLIIFTSIHKCKFEAEKMEDENSKDEEQLEREHFLRIINAFKYYRYFYLKFYSCLSHASYFNVFEKWIKWSRCNFEVFVLLTQSQTNVKSQAEMTFSIIYMCQSPSIYTSKDGHFFFLPWSPQILFMLLNLDKKKYICQNRYRVVSPDYLFDPGRCTLLIL